MLQAVDVSKKVKKTRIQLHTLDYSIRPAVETCFRQTLKNQSVTVEVRYLL